MSLLTRPDTAVRPRAGRDRLATIRTGLGPYARPHRRQLGQALLASVVVVLAQLAFPWPLKGFVELTKTQHGRSRTLSSLIPATGHSVTWLAVALVALGLTLGLAEYWQRVSVAKFVVRTVNDARVGLFTQLVQADSPGKSGRDAGDVLTRVVVDTARLRVGLKGVLIHLLQHGLFLVGVCAVLLALDLRLGLAYLLGLSLALALALGGAARTVTLARVRRARQSRAADQILRAGGQQSLKDPDRERTVAVITQVKGLTAVAVQGVLALTACSVLLLAVHFAEIGQLSAGDVAVVSSYLLMLHYPTMRMGRQITRLGPQITSAERLARLAEPRADRASRS